jgi:hypothetical protein
MVTTAVGSELGSHDSGGATIGLARECTRDPPRSGVP